MGTCHSKSNKIKRDKNHNRQKMFKFGVSFGRNDLNLEGHLQMGYNSKTIKNYGPINKQLIPPESTTSAVTEPNDQVTETSENYFFMTQIHAFFVSLVKKEDMAQATVDKCLESVYYDPKGRGS